MRCFREILPESHSSVNKAPSKSSYVCFSASSWITVEFVSKEQRNELASKGGLGATGRHLWQGRTADGRGQNITEVEKDELRGIKRSSSEKCGAGKIWDLIIRIAVCIWFWY